MKKVIDAHPDVLMCTVIGVKDSYRMQKVKAFVVLKPGTEATDTRKKEIMDYCRARLPRYAIPREVEFRTELPKTKVGKVAFTVLEKEEEEKQARSAAVSDASRKAEEKPARVQPEKASGTDRSQKEQGRAARAQARDRKQADAKAEWAGAKAERAAERVVRAEARVEKAELKAVKAAVAAKKAAEDAEMGAARPRENKKAREQKRSKANV